MLLCSEAILNLQILISTLLSSSRWVLETHRRCPLVAPRRKKTSMILLRWYRRWTRSGSRGRKHWRAKLRIGKLRLSILVEELVRASNSFSSKSTKKTLKNSKNLTWRKKNFYKEPSRPQHLSLWPNRKNQANFKISVRKNWKNFWRHQIIRGRMSELSSQTATFSKVLLAPLKKSKTSINLLRKTSNTRGKVDFTCMRLLRRESLGRRLWRKIWCRRGWCPVVLFILGGPGSGRRNHRMGPSWTCKVLKTKS